MSDAPVYDERVRVLFRMNKTALVAIWRAQSSNVVWTVTEPEQWSKDELISEILQREFPSGRN